MVIAVSTISGEARQAKIPPELLQQLVASKIACNSADDSLSRSMDTAERKFSEFVMARNSFPRSQREALVACEDLQILANKNPYAQQPLLVKNALEQLPDANARAFVGYDPGISENMVRYWTQFPPEEWQAAPGSIAILHNGRDRFIVWGASIDSKPLRDENGAIHILNVRLNLNNR